MHQRATSLVLILSVAWSIFVYIPTFAQRFNTIHYSQAEGLPGNHVNKVIQDRSGRLWVGTMNGATRFDGKNFVPFEPGNVLNNNPVKTIYEDRSGNIWFGTIRKGLIRFSGTSFSGFTTDDGLLSDNVNAVCEDLKGNLWIGTSEGLSRFDGRTFESFTTSKGLVNNNVFDLYCDHAGQLWIATIGGVSLFDGQRFLSFTTESGLLSNIVYAVRSGPDRKIWFGTYEGISVYDGKKFTSFAVAQGLPHERVEDLIADHTGHWWIGTYGGGLAKYNGGSFFSVKLGQDINSNVVKSVIEDREGNYWVGTMNGLFKYNGDRFVSYTTQDGLSVNNILSVFSDSSDYIWFGTLAGGINLYDGKSFRYIKTEQGLKSNTIWFISSDNSGKIWLGTTNGPAVIDPYALSVKTPYPELHQLIIYTILHDRKGGVYFGTDKGLYYYFNDSLIRIGVKEGLSNDKVRVLFEDEQGKIWIGTLKGLYVLEGKSVRSFDDAYKIPKAPVTSIISDQKGNLLISTYESGLVCYNPSNQANPLRILNSAKGLTNDKLLFCFIDRNDNLWLGTPGGIDKLNWKQYLESGKAEVIHYDKSNGYLGVESNSASGDKAGNLWFATVNGAIRFDPAAGDLPGTLPLVSISNIQLFLENVNWEKNRIRVNPHTGLPIDLVLPHNNNHMSFVFSGIYLTAPDEVKYRYMLENFEPAWSPPSKISIASYSNIPPGSYIFKVQATVNGKDWSVPVTYSFTIKPPIWRTPFFYLMYIVFGSGSILLVYRIRTRALRRSQELLKRKVEARTRELQAKNLELAKLSLVASETDNAVMIFDEHQEIEWVNAGYTKMTGFTLDELRRRKGGRLQDLTTNKEVLEVLDDCISNRKSFSYESEIEHRSGRKKWASSTLTPILDERGKLRNIVVIDTDITLRRHMEEQIREALDEKGLLLREIHHRVKNNLQIIISLFNLQTSYVDDENAYKALKEGQDRIKSMALIHERFYQADGLSRIDFDDYVRRLAENLMQSFRIPQGKVVLRIDAERISLDIDTAVPCGLIINEIVSNSLKHAFKGDARGEVFIVLKQTQPDHFCLTIGDDGVGMPENFTAEKSESLGIQLIHALTDQLEGTMEVKTSPGKGVVYTINFKRISQ